MLGNHGSCFALQEIVIWWLMKEHTYTVNDIFLLRAFRDRLPINVRPLPFVSACCSRARRPTSAVWSRFHAFLANSRLRVWKGCQVRMPGKDARQGCQVSNTATSCALLIQFSVDMTLCRYFILLYFCSLMYYQCFMPSPHTHTHIMGGRWRCGGLPEIEKCGKWRGAPTTFRESVEDSLFSGSINGTHFRSFLRK